MDWTLVIVCGMFTMTHLIVWRHYSVTTKDILEKLSTLQNTMVAWGWRAPGPSMAQPIEQPTAYGPETAIGKTKDGRLVRVPLAAEAGIGYGAEHETLYDDQGALVS